MAEDTKTFRELLLEQRNTNKALASLKQENRLMSDILKDIREDAIKDSTNQGILRSAIPEILSDTANTRSQTKKQVSEFDQQQKTFGEIAGNIREMVGISTEQLSLTKEINKLELTAEAEKEAEEERKTAIKKSKGDDDEKEGNKLTKALKEGVSGIFGGLKGVFFGTAGIFAAIFAFVAALGNEKFREVVFKATDAVGKAFVDFGELIEGDKGLLEFLRENFLTLTAITALLMPAKTFGLLFGAIKGLPAAIKSFGKNFKIVSSFFRIFTPIIGRFLLPLGLIIEATTGAVKAIDSAYKKFKETGNLLDALNLGFSTFVGYLISLPARIFKTLIDGALGLLEFITFGWLNFDTIQQKIRDLDFVGIITDAIYNVLTSADNFIQNVLFNGTQFLIDMGIKLGNFAGDMLDNVVGFVKDVGKKIYDPETGAIFGKVLPPFPTLGDIGQFLKDKLKLIYDPETGAIFGKVLPAFPTLGDIGQFLKDKAKLIYDSETGEIFGYQLPELPSISGMFDKIGDLAKKIYDPDTGAIFGLIPGKMFNFNLPNLGDLFMNIVGSMLPEPGKGLGRLLYKLPGTDVLEEAARAYSEGGKIVDGVMTMPDSTTSLDTMELDSMEAKKQYEMLMKKMEENEELTDKQKSFINQYNIMNGGNSVSQSSSSGVSIKKSATNDDYTIQMLAGSYA